MNNKRAALATSEAKVLKMMEAKERAVRAAGGPKALSRVLGISGPAVVQWDIVPPMRVRAVSRASKVPLHELTPDLFPPPRTPRSKTTRDHV